MKKFWIYSLALFIVACNNTNPKTETNEPGKSPEPVKSHLPVAAFIQEDIKKVDSFAGGILLKTINGSKEDSAFISNEAFHKLADEFLLPDLDSTAFSMHFTEASLMDETTEMLNFIYTADSNQSNLRKVIVYVSPSLSIDNISRVYMETETLKGDTTVSHKLTWKMRQYLIIAENKRSGAYNSVVIRKAIWDPQHFAD